ncbi:hypothetical protein [Archangium lipolyticum]|uniref:hypothetical protein n=1 Tax=Archangium lipolyticum TaxID=2970465 RepID=UPI002149D115|nr:hypothetical protein [Archangium lipolyticum]
MLDALRGKWRGVLGSALLCLGLVGCAPEDTSGSVMAYVFARDEATGQYALGRHPVDNLESLRELRGRDLDFRMGAELNQLSLGGEIDVVRGSPFALEYTREADGTIVPGDLHSMYALSLYRSLDRTASLLRAHGHVPLKRLDIFYYPRFDNIITGDGRAEFTDNAAYVSLVPCFLLVPTFVLSDLPMLLNEGVVAHEYGHAVIHQELFGDAKEAPHEGETDWEAAHRHLSSMHEGVADLLGLVATGDPDFIRATADVDRDLAEPRDYTAANLEELILGGDDFDPHLHGSLMARAVYELWPKDAQGRITPEGRARLLDATLATLRALKFEKDSFTLASFPNTLVTHLTAEERGAACTVLRTRLKPLASRFTSCE